MGEGIFTQLCNSAPAFSLIGRSVYYIEHPGKSLITLQFKEFTINASSQYNQRQILLGLWFFSLKLPL